MTKCLICGTENTADARFCKSCGGSLNKTPASDEMAAVSDTNAVEKFIINNRFRIIKKLGKGGMGEVLLAEDVKLKRRVAIKSILLRDTIADTTSKIRFLREAQTASQLDHPNICTIYEVYEEDDKDFIVMQYIDGVTLDQIIAMKKLSIDKTLDIAIQVCSGMMEANNVDIIHRDIKPGNIMVDKKGVVKILDFGLAKISSDSFVRSDDTINSNLTEKGFVLGTVAYISPEQARGKPLDCRTDVFSFGVVLYEMLEGKNPFKKDEQIETLYSVLNENITLNSAVPAELQEIVLKAMEKDREKRYHNFSRLKEDLEEFRSDYLKSKSKEIAPVPTGTETEVIEYPGQAEVEGATQRISEKEALGDLVYKIKKSKTSTQRVMPTQQRRAPWNYIIPVSILVAFLAIGLLFILNKKEPQIKKKLTTERFYVFLNRFENLTGEKDLEDMVDCLLIESLNQFDEFKTINVESIQTLSGNNTQNQPSNPLAQLKDKFNVTYEIVGKISRDNEFYTIDARLKPVGKGNNGKDFRLTSTGRSKDSLMINQVDLLTERVFHTFFPRESNGTDFETRFKKVSKMFGTNWDTFKEFFTGLRYYKRVDLTKAESYFLEAGDLLISKFYLSDLYFFDGRRVQALETIESIIPHFENLTPALVYRVKAIEARLRFHFKEAVENLKKLREALPFSKEVLYELGEIYFHWAHPEEASTYYEEALKLDPNYSKALNHLGYCYAYMGDHIKAIQLFESYRDIDQTANSFDSLGDGYFYSGDLLNAEAMKQRAVSSEKKEDRISWPYQTLADIYILKSDYPKALEALEEYRSLENSKSANATVYSKKAFIDFKEKKYESALKWINQSLDEYDSDKILDNTAEAHWIKGLILLASNKPEEAKLQLKWLERFVNNYNLGKENFNAGLKYYLHLHALVLEQENKKDEAESVFKELIGMKTRLSYWITYYNYSFFHTEYARFLNRIDQFDQALTEINRCLDFNGKYIPALWQKVEILTNLKNMKEADSVRRKIIEL